LLQVAQDRHRPVTLDEDPVDEVRPGERELVSLDRLALVAEQGVSLVPERLADVDSHDVVPPGRRIRSNPSAAAGANFSTGSGRYGSVPRPDGRSLRDSRACRRWRSNAAGPPDRDQIDARRPDTDWAVAIDAELAQGRGHLASSARAQAEAASCHIDEILDGLVPGLVRLRPDLVRRRKPERLQECQYVEGGRDLRSDKTVKAFPKRIQRSERVTSGELHHDEPTRVRSERGDERPKVRDVVQHVMTCHHVSWPDLAGDVRPAATDRAHRCAEPGGGLDQDAQQLLIAVDSGNSGRTWQKRKTRGAGAGADIENEPDVARASEARW